MKEIKILKTILFLLVVTILVPTGSAEAVRLKDLASVQGVRNNQLVGYGLVVGLNGTGDGSQTAFTTQGLINMLEKMGVHVNRDTIKVKNVAGVMVTATLPPFAKPGQVIDVVISSLGDCSSLSGGTLVATPLKGLDGKVYGMAQGPLSIGGGNPTTGGTAIKKHPTAARIPNGATVEREVPVSFAGKDNLVLSLENADFTTMQRMLMSIDSALGGDFATARDGSSMEVRVPDHFKGHEVELLALLENLEVVPDTHARVVLDERTGTVVMGENVRVSAMALSHGSLSLQVAAGAGQGNVMNLEGGDISLGELVRALNSIGVAPRDLIAIFQSIKAAGALQAELEII